jgi:hypothetical protein
MRRLVSVYMVALMRLGSGYMVTLTITLVGVYMVTLMRRPGGMNIFTLMRRLREDFMVSYGEAGKRLYGHSYEDV